MVVRHKSRAFILSAADYRETSKLLQVFCESEGKISLIAKGMKNPKSRQAQVADGFNLVQITYTMKDGATLGLLTGVEAERIYSRMRLKLDAYGLANYWLEILKLVGQARASSKRLFSLTVSFFELLDHHQSSRLEIIRHLLHLAQLLGFRMQMGQCGQCGTSSNLQRFDLEAGETRCGLHSQSRGRTVPLSENLHRVIQSLDVEQRDGTDLPPEELVAFLVLFNEHLQLHLEHSFRSFGFLRQVTGNA